MSPIKEGHIDTLMIAPELGAFKVPVYFTDELIQTPLSDLAFSSVSGILPYLFVGYFQDGGGLNKWYFSNARRHEEMRQAVEKDLGKGKLGYTYGQMWLDERAVEENGIWRFKNLMLHSELADPKDAEQRFRSVIKPEYLRGDFRIELAHFR